MNNFNQGKIIINKTEIQKLYKRQLDLVKENQELTRDIEFRDHIIMRLEKELRDLQKMLLIKDKEQIELREPKIIYERINIYG